MLHKIEIDDRTVIYGNDRFLKEFKQALLTGIQEYNTDTSAQHLSLNGYGEEIV